MNKSMSALVDIILVNYKAVDHTIECIESLLKIKYDNYRIIVVDNKSDDGSIKKLNRFKDRIIIIENKYNSGFAGGNNRAIEYSLESKAEYVLLLNNDTTVEEDFLNQLMDKTKDDIGICTSKILNYYDKKVIWYGGGEIIAKKGSTDVNGFVRDVGQFDVEKNVTFASGCCMLIKTKIIREIGMLNEDYFLYFEDTDYCAKVLKAGYKIKYCPKSIIYHKESVSTIRGSYNNIYYFNRNRLYFIKDNITGINRLIAYLYTIVFSLAKSLFTKQDIKPVFKAYSHFILGVKGKLVH